MTQTLSAIAFALLAWFVAAHRNGFMLSADGQAYWGKRTVSPFHLRWLLPKLLGRGWLAPWMAVSLLATLALGPLVHAWTGSLASAWLLVWLGVVQICVARPVMTDLPAMALALGAALAARAGLWWLAIPLALLAGACRESAPVFAAAWALEPVLLVGVIAAGWWRKAAAVKPGTVGAYPWGSARKQHDLLDWRRMLAPWGAVAALAPLGAAWDRETLAAVLALALGYGQLLRARDGARLFTWAAPAVLVLAARVDAQWTLPLLFAHPWLALSERRKLLEVAAMREAKEAAE